MTVSKNEVDQMASFMRALNASSVEEQHSLDKPVRTVPVESESATQEMKIILERFHAAAGGAVTKVNEEAVYDRDLREALVTERTSRGARVGNWEILVHEHGKRKFYDVVHIDGISCIAADLVLYEAAHGLVRILNEGGRLNSREAVNLLRAEQDYTSAVNDAVLYRHYMKNPKDARIAVFEAKYSAAKQRAITARNMVTSIAEQR